MIEKVASRLTAGFFITNAFVLALVVGTCDDVGSGFLEPVQAQTNTSPTLSQGQTCPNPEPSAWDQEQLKGKVKEIKIEKVSHYGDRSEREVVNQISFDANGNYLTLKDPFSIPSSYRPGNRKTTFVFDADCRPVERLGLESTEWGLTKTVYVYENKRIKEESTYQAEKGWLLFKKLFNYNDIEKTYEEIRTIQSHPEHYRPPRYDIYITTKTVYKLDERGNKVAEVGFYPDNSVADRSVYEYDSKDRPLKTSKFDKRGRLMEERFFKYSEKDLLTEQLEYDNNCFVGTEDTLCEGILDSGDGKFSTASKTSYEYDQRGNWIKKTELFAGDPTPKFRPFEETYRTITYY